MNEEIEKIAMDILDGDYLGVYEPNKIPSWVKELAEKLYNLGYSKSHD